MEVDGEKQAVVAGPKKIFVTNSKKQNINSKQQQQQQQQEKCFLDLKLHF